MGEPPYPSGVVVYVVQSILEDGWVDEVVAVCSTRELAEAAAEEARQRSAGWPVEVSAWEIDSGLVTE